jgi:hypothetical protein
MSPASGNTISPHHVEESYQGRTVDALASSAEEGRGTLRKASGSRVQALYPGMSEWGNPPVRRKTGPASRGEHIAPPTGTWGTETSQYPEEQKSFR